VSATSTARAVSHGALVDSTSTIEGNSNLAVATMNDAANKLTVAATSEAPEAPAMLVADGIGGAQGDAGNLLVNTQFSTGSVVANAQTRLLGSQGLASLGADGPTNSRFKIATNVTGAQASGNQALNSVALASANGGLANSQMNLASIAAVAGLGTGLDVPAPGRSVSASSVTVLNNSTSALARGNVAQNNLTVAATPNGPGSASANSGRFDTHAEAPAALVSMQTSYGSVSASVMGPISAMPLNLAGVPVDASRVTVDGNALAATAYGNGVANTVVAMAGNPSGLALVSGQTNYGAVTAQVSATAASLNLGNVTRSSLGIVNNTVSASATGNLATNIVGLPR
jgi:hypothetical protein